MTARPPSLLACPTSRICGWTVVLVAVTLSLASVSELSWRPDRIHLPACSEPTDAALFPWNLSWFAHRGWHEGLYTRSLYYPTGESLALYTPTFAYDVVAAPLVLALGPNGPHVATLLLLAGSTLATVLVCFALARQMGMSRFAALGGALLFAVCAGRMMNAARLNLFCTEFLLLYFLLGLRAWQRPGRSRGLLAGAALALLLWQSQPLFFQAGIASMVFLLGTLRNAEGRRSLRARGRCLGWVAVAAGVLAAPFLWAMIDAMQSSPALAQSAWMLRVPAANLDLASMFLPHGFDLGYGAWLGRREASIFEGQAAGSTVSFFLGFGWWILILVACFRRPAKEWLPLLAFGLSIYLVAQGPVLRWLGQELPFPAPYRLVGWFPLVRLSKSPLRLMLLVQLGMALLAARGIQRLLHFPRHARRVAAGALLGIAVFEQCEIVPFHEALELSIPPRMAEIAAESGEFAVLDLPYDGPPFPPAHRSNAVAMSLAAVHLRPIFFGLFPRASRRNLTEHLAPTRFFQELAEVGRENPPESSERALPSDPARSRGEMEALGIRYVQVHFLRDGPAEQQALAQRLLLHMRALGPSVEERLLLGPTYEVVLLRFEPPRGAR